MTATIPARADLKAFVEMRLHDLPGLQLDYNDITELEHVAMLTAEQGFRAQISALDQQMLRWYDERVERPARLAKRKQLLGHTPLRQSSRGGRRSMPHWQRARAV